MASAATQRSSSEDGLCRGEAGGRAMRALRRFGDGRCTRRWCGRSAGSAISAATLSSADSRGLRCPVLRQCAVAGAAGAPSHARGQGCGKRWYTPLSAYALCVQCPVLTWRTALPGSRGRLNPPGREEQEVLIIVPFCELLRIPAALSLVASPLSSYAFTRQCPVLTCGMPLPGARISPGVHHSVLPRRSHEAAGQSAAEPDRQGAGDSAAASSRGLPARGNLCAAGPD
eukprot:3936514-Rhodomonas_salina.1